MVTGMGDRCRGMVEVQPVCHHPRQRRGENHGSQADKEALDAVAARVLGFGKQIRDQGAQRLHGDVDRGIQHPQQSGGHPQRGGIGQEHQGGRAQERAIKQIRPPAAQAAPSVIAQAANDRLDQQPREGGRQPEQRNLIGLGPEIFVDGAHVGHLRPKPN